MAWFDDLNLPGSTITGHFAFVREDGPDVDDAPDIQLASGKVRFEPTAKAVRAGGAWIGISPVTAVVFDGELVVAEEDPRPLRLLSTDADTGVEGWGWKASFDITGASIKPISFRAPAVGVHLTGDDLIPITGNPVEVLSVGGAQGLSAYEVAVENGFVGTEEEWLASLHGSGGGGGGGISGTGVDAIVALTQAEYDSLTPDPRTLYVVTSGEDPEEPEEPGPQGTLSSPLFGEPVYAGNPSPTSSIALARPSDLYAGDLVVVALRSQEGNATYGWTAPAGFIPAFNEPSSWPSTNRVAGVWVKPITSPSSEPEEYIFSGPTGRNVGVAVKANIGTASVSKVATAPYGSTSNTVAEQTLTAAPALSLAVLGAECTNGISHVPSSTPSGFATVGNTQSSLDASTSGSRTAVWLGWRYEPDASVESLVGGHAGSSATALYYGAISGGA